MADACLLIGTNPRWEAPLVNARLRKRYLQGGFHIAAIGPALDLTFPVEMLGEGGETVGAVRWQRCASLGRTAASGEEPDADRRARGADAAGWRAGAGDARARSPKVAAWCATAGTGSMCCTAPRRGSAASISASCRDRAGAMSPASSTGCRSGEIEVLYLLGADEIDISDLGSAFVDLSGTPRRSRRRARRRDPAGRGLYREGRHLRQYRGTGAARPPRRLSARRGARGLGDHPCALGCGRPAAALRHVWASCAGACAPPIRPPPGSTG